MKSYISKTQMSTVLVSEETLGAEGVTFTVSPHQLRQMMMGLKERMKVRERQENKRRTEYFK